MRREAGDVHHQFLERGAPQLKEKSHCFNDLKPYMKGDNVVYCYLIACIFPGSTAPFCLKHLFSKNVKTDVLSELKLLHLMHACRNEYRGGDLCTFGGIARATPTSKV